MLPMGCFWIVGIFALLLIPTPLAPIGFFIIYFVLRRHGDKFFDLPPKEQKKSVKNYQEYAIEKGRPEYEQHKINWETRTPEWKEDFLQRSRTDASEKKRKGLKAKEYKAYDWFIEARLVERYGNFANEFYIDNPYEDK